MVKRDLRRRAAAVWLAIAAAALLVSAASPAASAVQRISPGTAASAAVAPGHGGAASTLAPADTQQVCAAPAQPGVARCLSLIRTDVQARAQATAAAPPAGYGPDSLQWAYTLPSTRAGGGRTVAIVDAYDDPNAASDLATYRSQYGLPACTAASGCFTKVNESGQASPLPVAAGGTGWATEESLDVDMVSAICPNCRILLVEANSAALTDLGTAVNSAVSLGAKFISNSYGAAEFSTEGSDDSAYYNHPGVAVTAAAGDGGYGVSFPAASPHVVAVGGTSLTTASGSRGWTETAWSGTGSGCSAYEPKPSWQTDTGCARRTDNDVSAVADPQTGLAVYDSYDQGGWVEVGGTSAASPIIAAAYALGGYPATGSYPASFTYTIPASLFDVTSAANGSCSPAYLCTAGPGYDGPTGLGTPNAVQAFSAGGGPGNEAAFQASTGHLWVEGSAGTGDTGLGMAAGTSPSIAALPGGGYEIAFQASNGHLWVDGSGGSSDTGLGMAAGTSPSLTDLPPENNPFFPNGGIVAAFQGSNGNPWDYSGGGGGDMSTRAFLAPGTSPAIAPISGGGAFQVLWQGTNNHLWTTGDGPTDTGLAMTPGTSPALADLLPNNPFFPNGGTVAAFQGSNGNPWDYSGGGGGDMSTRAFLAPGTSPAIAPISDGGAFQVLWQGTNNHLWTTGDGPTDLGFTMRPGTSPAITQLS